MCSSDLRAFGAAGEIHDLAFDLFALERLQCRHVLHHHDRRGDAVLGCADAAADRERPADALERFLRCYDRRLIAHTRPYPGIGEVLAQLAPAHRLAVLTNKPLTATRQILAGLGLAHHFAPELVFGGDGPYPRKPDAEGLRALIAMTGSTPSTTWLVGDSVVDWRTAQAAGSPCCLCRYGFGFEGVPAEVLTENQPVIDSPAELPVILASAACNES